MKCQTTDRGVPCKYEASHVVGGGVINFHVACKMHAARWVRLEYLTPLDIFSISEANNTARRCILSRIVKKMSLTTNQRWW